ncbi:MAG: zf-TFIIB domain-containing protein [Anaerolineae bacterium]|jgi:hypothetical protein|nr:zf-TFIIB domain-containing protein [Anaerolineae bacterium]
MLCPNCNVVMRMTIRQGVELDYCPNCRGIWLDKGELDKLMERAVEERAPAHPPERHYTPSAHEATPKRKHPDEYYDDPGLDEYQPRYRAGKKPPPPDYDYDDDRHDPRRRRRNIIEDIFDIFD